MVSAAGGLTREGGWTVWRRSSSRFYQHTSGHTNMSVGCVNQLSNYLRIRSFAGNVFVSSQATVCTSCYTGSLLVSSVILMWSFGAHSSLSVAPLLLQASTPVGMPLLWCRCDCGRTFQSDISRVLSNAIRRCSQTHAVEPRRSHRDTRALRQQHRLHHDHIAGSRPGPRI